MNEFEFTAENIGKYLDELGRELRHIAGRHSKFEVTIQSPKKIVKNQYTKETFKTLKKIKP